MIELISLPWAIGASYVIDHLSTDTRAAAQPSWSTDIDYRVNSQGYRTLEWDQCNWQQSIVIFGCSNAFGVGLANHQTWPYQLSQRLNRPVINLGFPGASSQLLWMNTIRLARAGIKPWMVIYHWPPISRMLEFLDSPDQFVPHGSWSEPGWALDMITHEYQLPNMTSYYVETVKLIWHDIPVINAEWEQISTVVKPGTVFDRFNNWPHFVNVFSSNDRARDGIHPGPTCNLSAADQFEQLARQLLSNHCQG